MKIFYKALKIKFVSSKFIPGILLPGNWKMDSTGKVSRY